MTHIKSDQKLGRTLSFFSVFAIGTGTMIGAGIFVLPGIAAASAGPAAIISFLVGGLITLATALSMAELATGMPRAGGTYYFISRAMGPVFGTIVGIGAWLALVFKGSFALIGLAEYLEALVPVPVLITAIVAGILLLILNYRGAENSGTLQNGIVIGLLIILVLFISKGLFNINQKSLDPFVPYGPGSIMTTTGLIFVSYLGITQLAAVSEEVKNPSRNLPLAFIGSVITVTLLYGGIMLIVNGLIPLEELSVSGTPLITAADILGGNGGRIAIIFAGFFATISTANAAILSSSRFPFAMGRDKIVPQKMVDIHENFGTPTRSIIITGATMLLLVLLFNVEQLAKLGSTFNALIFALVNLSVLIMRNVEKDWYRPSFRDPFYPFTQIFGALAALSLIPKLGTMPLIFSGAVITVGILWYGLYGRGKALPNYNLLDMLDEDRIPKNIDESKKRVMVAIGNKKHEKDLVHLANNLEDEIIGVHVNKVPLQTGLLEARNKYNVSKCKNIFQDNFEIEINPSVKKCKYIEVFSHDIAESIVEQVEEENVDLLVIGWHKDDRLNHYIDNITHKIISHARSHLAILRGYFPDNLTEITVPFGGGESSQYAYYLARRLAINTRATVKLARVIDPETNAEKVEQVENELESQVKLARKECRVQYKIYRRFSIPDTLIDLCNNSELMIMGDSNRRFKKSLFGHLPHRVSRHSSGPLLLVKRYRQLSKRGMKSYLKQKKTSQQPDEKKD
ncbi:MAG: amino acid permease [Halanaerobiaceae bacterium]